MELKELGLPDRVLTMGWCGDSICLGFHRECATSPYRVNHNIPSSHLGLIRCLTPGLAKCVIVWLCVCYDADPPDIRPRPSVTYLATPRRSACRMN